MNPAPTAPPTPLSSGSSAASSPSCTHLYPSNAGPAAPSPTRHASQDADRLDSALEGRATTVVPGFTVTARPAPFDVSDHQLFTDPYEADAVALLAAAVEGVTAA
ncbi:hypothetical protein [Streptomyces sp. NPDC059970]|uniref:hypothetical protein n=1 Tax=Streptomyces sp. NPDC059970 TaxID=3347019 RepID=UPI0036812A94